MIVVSTLSVSGALMYRSYQDLEATLVTSASSLGATLAQTLIPPLLHDDVWRGFAIVRAPFRETHPASPIQPETAIVLTLEQQIFVSSDPDRFPMLARLQDRGKDFTSLENAIGREKALPVALIEPEDSERIFVTIPMIDSGTHLGTLVLVYSRSALNSMFVETALGGALIGLIVLSVLLPLTWYWGRRMATPLVRVAQRMDAIQHRLPEHLEPELYNYRDELGHLFEAYNRMVEALREKALLERSVLSAERLAAVGRLTAVMAHEINNPLAGMLTALDTLKRRGLDERSLRTLGLLERGLLQVRDTVAALLVEARPQKRDLSPQDLDDIRTLMQPAATKSGVRLEIEVNLTTALPVPAGPVRQVLINLLNNAIEAAASGSWVRCAVAVAPEGLGMEVVNSGDPIPPDRLEHLFEPFVSYREGGLGLGLWVTYQLVSQLAGRIEVSCEDGAVRFAVSVPIDEAQTEAEAA